jgi:predicted nucleic acid-binding protein
VEGSARRRASAVVHPATEDRPDVDASKLMPLLVDAGILYAMADRSDDWHGPIVAYLREHRPSLLAPVTVVPEATYLVHTRLGSLAERKLVESFTKGEVAVEPLKPADLARALALISKYPEMGFTDSTVVAMAERLALDTIATTDCRHFGLVRPTHAKRFTLVP